MAKSKLRIGYIVRFRNDYGRKFEYVEDSYYRKITSKGDKVYSKMLLFPAFYEDVEFTTEQMRRSGIIIVQEPFFVDDELRDKAKRWVEWANNANPKEYDPFAGDDNNYE